MANNVQPQVWEYEAQLTRNGRGVKATGKRQIQIRSTDRQAAMAKAYAEASQRLLDRSYYAETGSTMYELLPGYSIAVTYTRHIGSVSGLVRQQAASANRAVSV